MALVGKDTVASAFRALHSDHIGEVKPRMPRRRFRSFEEELADVIERNSHSLIDIEWGVESAADTHGVSYEYATARLEAHPLFNSYYGEPE